MYAGMNVSVYDLYVLIVLCVLCVDFIDCCIDCENTFLSNKVYLQYCFLSICLLLNHKKITQLMKNIGF